MSVGRFTLDQLPPHLREQAQRQLDQGELPKFVPPKVADSKEASCRPNLPIRLMIVVVPMGKPRMTQRDKWAKRPEVVRYHEFRDTVRAKIRDDDLSEATEVSWTAYFPFPKSWSQKKKESLAGCRHRSKPDRDNVDKAILDALFSEDCLVADGTIKKRWDDGKGPRIELMIT